MWIFCNISSSIFGIIPREDCSDQSEYQEVGSLGRNIMLPPCSPVQFEEDWVTSVTGHVISPPSTLLSSQSSSLHWYHQFYNPGESCEIKAKSVSLVSIQYVEERRDLSDPGSISSVLFVDYQLTRVRRYSDYISQLDTRRFKDILTRITPTLPADIHYRLCSDLDSDLLNDICDHSSA